MADPASNPSSDLGEGGQVTEEMIEAAAQELARSIMNPGVGPSQVQRSRARDALKAALPLSPLSRRVEELEAALKPFAWLGDLADSYGHSPQSTCEWRIKAADLYVARALLKDGER